MEQIDYFKKLFYPKTIAFIGASKKRLFHLSGLVSKGFEGKLYFVSKSSDEILGIKCLKDISELPDGIDHAIIGVNKTILVDIVKKCIQKNFSTIHIFTAGLGEFDEKGEKTEDEIYSLLKHSKTRAIGPNCLGLYSTGGKFTFNPVFKSEPVGNVAIICQSGDLSERFISNLNYFGVNFSVGASIGNSISINTTDLIQMFNEDDSTEIIAVYFEGFSKYHPQEGRRLYNLLKNVNKPVIFLRSGKTEAGKRSAESHTGSLSGTNNIWNAMFNQTKAISVRTFEELMDTTLAFSYCKNKIPKNKGILIMTWSGGNATIATDLLSNIGLEIPEFSKTTQDKLKKLVNFGGISNPLDMPWINFSDLYANLAKIAINEPYIGGIFAESYKPSDNQIADGYFANIEFLRDLCDELGKPFFMSLPFAELDEKKEFQNKIINRGIPVFRSFERAAKAFLNVYNFYNQSINK